MITGRLSRRGISLGTDEERAKAWLDECHQLAITVAYDAEVTDFVRRFEQDGPRTELPRLSLSEGYLKQGGAGRKPLPGRGRLPAEDARRGDSLIV